MQSTTRPTQQTELSNKKEYACEAASAYAVRGSVCLTVAHRFARGFCDEIVDQ
jgi:hypothetical protein